MVAEVRANPEPVRKPDFDASGRLLPIPEGEKKAGAEAFARMLESVATMSADYEVRRELLRVGAARSRHPHLIQDAAQQGVGR